MHTVDLIILVWGKYRLILFLQNENYYLQVLLGECKYIGKEKFVIRYITDYLKISSDDSDKED